MNICLAYLAELSWIDTSFHLGILSGLQPSWIILIGCINQIIVLLAMVKLSAKFLSSRSKKIPKFDPLFVWIFNLVENAKMCFSLAA